MATVKPKTKSAKTQPGNAPEKWPFGKKNYMWFGIAMVVMIIGYVALGQGSITLAPFLLVVAYCVLVPVAILVKDEPKPDADQSPESGQ
jgi:hypothetical protein